MSDAIEYGRLKLTPADEKAISEKTSDEIKEYLHDLAVSQGLAKRDWDPTIMHAVPLAPIVESQPLTREVVINNTVYTIQAADEAGLNEMELKLHRSIMGVAEEQTPVEQPRNESGQFRERTDEEQAAANSITEADLKLKMMRGELSVAEYMRQSPEAAEVFDERLRSVGIDRQAISEQQEVANWSESVERWLAESPVGSAWEGGEANRAKILELLEANPELPMDTVAEKIAALDVLAKYMRENNLMQRNPEIVVRESIGQATNVEDIRRLAHQAQGRK